MIEFFEEVLGNDPLSGEIAKEFPVKDRYCDFAIVLDRKNKECKPNFLVEAKAAGVKSLNEKNIEQLVQLRFTSASQLGTADQRPRMATVQFGF